MSEQNSAEPDWGERIRAARTARDAGTMRYETTLRAANAAGRGINQIARDLGIQDRTAIMRVLDGPEAVPDHEPRLPVVVYLRSRRATARIWADMNAAMHARGWVTVTSDDQAWHLSRALVPALVRVDFDNDGTDEVTVTLQQAKYLRAQETPTIESLLPTMAVVALRRAFPDAADLQVTITTETAGWKTLASHTRPFPLHQVADRPGWFLDCQKIARWVSDLIE